MEWIDDFDGWRIYLNNEEYQAREFANPSRSLQAETLEEIKLFIQDANNFTDDSTVD